MSIRSMNLVLAISAVFCAQLCRTSDVLSQDIYAILAVDTCTHNAETLGIPVDGARLSNWLSEACATQGIRLYIKMLAGTECNPEQLLKTIQESNVTNKDTLLVYYSGHGGTDPKNYNIRTYYSHVLGRYVVEREYDGGTKGHYLAMSSGAVKRTSILDVMTAKTNRLSILLTDCCSGYSGIQALDSQKSDAYMRLQRNLRNPTYKAVSYANTTVFSDLFLKRMGILNISARMPGDNTSGDTVYGGHFTYAVLAAMGRNPVTNTPQDGLKANWASTIYSSWSILDGIGDLDQATGIDVKTAFGAGIESAISTDYRYDTRLGAHVNGSLWKVDSSGLLANSVTPGLYTVESLYVDGKQYIHLTRGVYYSPGLQIAMAMRNAQRSIQVRLAQINISGDRRDDRRHYDVAVDLSAKNETAVNAVIVTNHKYRVDLEGPDGVKKSVTFTTAQDNDIDAGLDRIRAQHQGYKVKRLDPVQ